MKVSRDWIKLKKEKIVRQHMKTNLNLNIKSRVFQNIKNSRNSIFNFEQTIIIKKEV